VRVKNPRLVHGCESSIRGLLIKYVPGTMVDQEKQIIQNPHFNRHLQVRRTPSGSAHALFLLFTNVPFS
jgi:hypothetical protein